MSHWKGYGPDNALPAGVDLTDAGPSQGSFAGTLTYELHYGLKAKPFSLSTDPRSVYLSPDHAQVFDEVLGAIRRREGLIVLTGDMGTGKTTLCRAALYQLDRKTFTTFVPDPFLSREDLLRMLLVGFGEVSVDDLRQGRLRGTPRADLGCQLYEFLTSLESVDAFAVLVIDEAQHLAAPLLDEIRALSEMEAGRRLLQIVLVGQPELRSRLKLPEMQHIAQRVTTACGLPPLTREGVGGYVAHRLGLVGGTRDRVDFSATALDLIYDRSGGIPRLVNRICDRALFHGHLDRASLIGQTQVARALHDLELPSPRVEPAQTVGNREPEARSREPEARSREPEARSRELGARSVETEIPKGFFQKSTVAEEASPIASELRALLDLPAVPRKADQASSDSADRPRRARHRSPTPGVRSLRSLKAALVPALGMLVMLLVGAVAALTLGPGAFAVKLPTLPASPRPVAAARTPERLRVAETVAATPTPQAAAVPVPASLQQTWVVQVAAFSSSDRASAAVQQLIEAGMPAYRVEADLGVRGRLNMVRVGPYDSAEIADQARAELRSSRADYEGAFVRNITTRE